MALSQIDVCVCVCNQSSWWWDVLNSTNLLQCSSLFSWLFETPTNTHEVVAVQRWTSSGPVEVAASLWIYPGFLASKSKSVQPASWWSRHFYSPIRVQARPRDRRHNPMASRVIAGVAMTTSSWKNYTVFQANPTQIHGTAVLIWGTVEAQLCSPSSAWHCLCKGHNSALVVQ